MCTEVTEILLIVCEEFKANSFTTRLERLTFPYWHLLLSILRWWSPGYLPPIIQSPFFAFFHGGSHHWHISVLWGRASPIPAWHLGIGFRPWIRSRRRSSCDHTEETAIERSCGKQRAYGRSQGPDCNVRCKPHRAHPSNDTTTSKAHLWPKPPWIFLPTATYILTHTENTMFTFFTVVLHA